MAIIFLFKNPFLYCLNVKWACWETSHFCFAAQSRSESWAVINRSMKRGKNRSLLMLQSPRTQSEEVAGRSLQTLTETDRMSRRQETIVLFPNLYFSCFVAALTFLHLSIKRQTEARRQVHLQVPRDGGTCFYVGQLSYRALFSTKYSRTEVGWAVEMSHNVAPCVQWECLSCVSSHAISRLWFDFVYI